MALAGIPSIPGGTPGPLANFLTAVRNRLLAISGSQFTDSEVTRLRALLGSGSTTEQPVSGVITFLDTPYAFYGGTGVAEWRSFSVEEAGVPKTAKAVIIDAMWVCLSDLGVEERWAALRVDSSLGNTGNTIDSTFVLARGLRGGAGGQTSGAQQGIYPVVDGKFEYSSGRYGYGWSDITLRIIGSIS